MNYLIVDDHPLTRGGTASALKELDPAAQVSEAENLEGALASLDANPATGLILLDLNLGDSNGIDTLVAVRSRCAAQQAPARIVVLSGMCDPDLVRNVLEQYATGFILKATSREVFSSAIALTLAGGIYIPPIVLSHWAAPTRLGDLPKHSSLPPSSPLSPRETEVAALLIQGLTYKRIARELGRNGGAVLSEHTVRAHVGNIAWKLGVTENAKYGVMAEIARRGLTFPKPVAKGAG